MKIFYDFSAPSSHLDDSPPDLKGVVYEVDLSVDPPEARVFYTRGSDSHLDMLKNRTGHPMPPRVIGSDDLGRVFVGYYDNGSDQPETIVSTTNGEGYPLNPHPSIALLLADHALRIGLGLRKATSDTHGVYYTEPREIKEGLHKK